MSELSRQIEELQKLKESMVAILSEESAKLDELRKLGAEIASKINTTQQKIKEADWDLRQLKRDKEAEEKRQEEEEKLKAAQAEFERVRNELEALTFDAPWRKENREDGNGAYEFQIEGAMRLAIAKRGILADKRGLGKTLSSIISLDMLDAQRVLVMTPADVASNCMREFALWQPGRVAAPLYKMNKVERDLMISYLKQLDQFAIVMNYEAIWRDDQLLKELIDLKLDTVIFDEAHRLKNLDSKSAERALDLIYSANPVANVIPMTGSPILNRPQELFPLLHLIDREAWHSESQFLYGYCQKSWSTNRWEFQPGGEERLVEKLGHRIVMRDRKSAGVTVPPQTIQIHEIEFDPKKYRHQYRVLSQLNEWSALVLTEIPEKIVLAPAIELEVILRKRQAITWPAGIELKDPETKEVMFRCDARESQKLDFAEDLIKQLLDEDERVVLFSQFNAPLLELERRFGRKAVTFTGHTTDWQSEQIKLDFDAKTTKNRWQVLLANHKKGGVGLNLNAATQMVILDQEWNPGKEDQSYGRIDRLNNTEETTVHVLRVNNSIDTWLADLIDQKAKVINGFEDHVGIAQQMRAAIKNGEMI